METGQTYKILNIPAGRSSGTIRIPIIDDQVYESADETFTLQLTNHNNKATLDGGATSLTATGAIADDDPKPVVSVAGPAGDMSYVSENAKDPVTFTLALIGQSAGDVSVDYATGEAGLVDLLTARQGLIGATEDEDYAGISGTVTFTSGETTKTVTVQVTNDDVSEDTEFFGFKISAPQGADLRGQRSEDVADVGLLDDDPRGVTIDPISIGLDEPASGETAVAGSYTVHLNSRPTGTVIVTVGGSAPAVSLSGETLTNNQLTFTSTNWNTAQTVTVTPAKDDNAAGETIILPHTLSGGDYAGIAADSVTVNLTDSDTRNIVLSKESLTVTEGDATGDRYTVMMATQPSDTVTVTISGHEGADLTLSGTTLTSNQLTFTTTNWGTAQTVTVKAGDDDNADNESETLTHTASGGDYVNVAKDLPVSITDDGDVQVTVMFGAGAYTVPEGGTQSVRVTLSVDPERTVVIPLTATNQGEATSNDYSVPDSVSFDAGEIEQTITFTAMDDSVDDDGESVLLAFGTGLPTGVSLGTNWQATVSITDDDEAGIVLSETDLTVTEGDAAGASYTVKLATEPTGEVTVTVSGHAGTDLSLSGTTLSSDTLTFTVDGWNTAQTVTVRAGEDEDGANDTGTLTHTASSGGYASVTKDLPVAVTDDDQAGIVLNETDLTVTEGDAAGASYTVKLATEPTGEVTVTVSGHAGTDLSLSGTTLSSDTLTFTVDGWNTAQTVTVRAGEDEDGSNDSGTLTHTALGGDDYVNVTKDLPVSITDDDTPAIVLSKTDLSLTEGDAAGMSYTVALATKPSAGVSVSITGHSGTDLSLDKTTLTFTTGNWNTAQTVTVTAAEDDDGVVDPVATLTHTASGGDYANLTRDLTVTVTENDTPDIVISRDSLIVVEGDAAGMSYTVALATQPSDTVIVAISGHDGTDLTLSGTGLTNNQLTFTVDNWDAAQTVTVEAGQDNDGANDTATLTHTASGGDYVNVTKDLPVTVTDDDTADIVLSETDLIVTEGDAAGSTYTVKLATRPSETAIVTISGHDGTDLTLSGTTLTNNQLTFTSTTWDTAQTVTVKAGDDDNADNESETLAHTAFGGDYVNITKDLPVAVTDDAPAGVSVSFGQAAYRVIEGAGVSVTVSLNEDPERTVVIPLVVTNQGGASDSDHSGVPERVTFNSGDTSTSFTLTAADDNLNETGESVRIAFGALPSTPIPVTAGSPDETTVTINGRSGQDVNTPPTVHFASAAYSVDEGNTVAVTVELSKAPGSDAVIPLTTTEQGEATFEDYSGVPVELTFEAADTQRTFTFAANQDTEDDDGESVLLGFSALPGGITATTGEASQATVAIMDDDDPQVTVSFGADAYTVPEGGTQSVRVTLSVDPERTVEIPLTATDQSTATPADYIVPDSVTFDAGEIEQTITFTAMDDFVDDDGKSVLLAFGPSLPTGVSLGTTGQATVSIDDDDEAGIALSEAALSLEEGDATGASYTVKLATQPTGNVTVTISGHAGTDLSLSGTTLSSDMLTFTVDDWNTAQTVTVRAGQDADGANDTGTLMHTASGGGYVNVTKDLPVAVTDDDQAGIVLSETDLTVTEGDAAGSSYTVRLATQPTGNVTVTISGHAGTDLSLSGTTLSSDMLTFTVDDWNTAQTVTVRAGQDADGANDTGTLTHTASGGGYVNVTKDLPVAVTDDDQAGVAVSFDRASYRVLEGDAVTVGVTLSGDPKRTVVIHLVATEEGGASSEDYSGVPSSVTINEGETSTSFNFTATQDDVDETCECVLLTFGALPSGVSAGPTDEAKVSIIDNAMHNGPPTVPPGPFGLTAYGEDQALYVRWETPAAEDQRAPVSSYRMRYRQVGASSWRNVSRANDGLTLWENLTGLTNRRAYEVQVAAVNRMGTGAWVSVKGTPQAPYAPPPGPEGDEAFEVGRLRIYWLDPDADHTNVLHRESCTGSAGFRAFWNGPDGNRRADEWAVHINTRGGAGEVSYSFDESSGTPDGHYFSMSGTVNFEGVGALSLGVRGRFGSTWGTWWSPPVSLYCHEPEAPADTCSLQVQQQAVENTPAEGEPRIDGIPEVGQTLSADTTATADADGLNDVVFNYHWMSDDADIPGATESTYTVVSGDVGQAISVRVAFTDDGGNEETLTSAPIVVTAAGLLLRSATVDRGILTLTYSKDLDTGVTLGTAPFAVNVNGSSRSLSGVAVGQSNVLLLLSSAVEAGDTVTVEYTVPDGPDFIRDIRGRKAASFSGQAVTNSTVEDQEDTARGTEDADTDPEYASAVVEPPLTATIHDAPASHDGSAAFTFELEFSEELAPDFSYTTMRDDGFTVTGGRVTYVRRLNPPSNIGWEVHVTPDGNGEVTLSLRSTTDCSAQGAICTGEGRKLSGGLQLAVAGPNTPATGAPSITGTVRVGETLTAGTTDISDGDGLGNAAFAYQWLAADAEINGATASTYTLADDDQGKTIRVRVSFADDAGNNEMLTSAATGAVDAAPPPPNTPATGAPSITGTVRVGETLTAGTTDISDGDGLGNAAFAYQWLAGDADINGATASTYTLADDDEGKTIRVRVSFADDAGNNEMLTSAATGAVDAAPPPPNTPATGTPTISGTAWVSETLTASTTDISDADGMTRATFSYQWLADDSNISGATDSSYTLVAADAGKAIRVRVSFTDDAENGEELTSAATGAVDAAPPPPNTPATGAPTITGTVRVGETLTVSTTDISDADGLGNAAFAYQWLADDSNLSGATDSSYTLVVADAGKAIRVRVTFADDAGNNEELTSDGTGAVAAAVVRPPLTATARNVPSSHDGSATFLFELSFSEEFPLSYVALRDHAFTVSGGRVTYVRRLNPPSNIGWEIHVTPDSGGSLIIVLPVTGSCQANGAICTEDGRRLSNRLEFTVNGP